jgi:hypothetical protein
MDSPAFRAFVILRQRFLLLSGPWLGVSVIGFLILKMVQQVKLQAFPVLNASASRGLAYPQMHAELTDRMRANFISVGILECVEVVQIAAKILALALTVLLVRQVAVQGADRFSAAWERLWMVPEVTRSLLKFFAIVIVVGLGTTLVAVLPVVVIVPLRGALHMPARIPRWMLVLSAELGKVLFVCCVMPFLLNLVWRLEGKLSSDEKAPQELLLRALGYGAVTVSVEVGLTLLLQPIQLEVVQRLGGLMGQTLIGLAANLLTALPTVVCMVAISLMVLGAEVPAIEVEPA